MIPSIEILDTGELGPFTFHWWAANDEAFDRGWEVLASVDGKEAYVRHGVGRRHAYGRERVHSVTWVDLRPMVEGVEADDYVVSSALLSGIRLTKRFLRPEDPVPAEYRGFEVVVQSDELRAPRTRRILALKLREDDVEGWTRHALLRAVAWEHLPTPPLRKRVQTSTRTSAPVDVLGDSPEQKAGIVEALLAFAANLKAEASGPTVEFTAIPEANALLRNDPFAFLVAVICDQGIPAERAWRAPWELQRRLGHLDPARIAAEPGAVREAIQTEPKLHRFVNTIPGWLVAAARRVLSRWDGDAGRVWAGSPDAGELQGRFEAFLGIGQKKAAMAVAILSRDLGVTVKRMDQNDVAYDIHLRRVFLRSHLAERDDRDQMIGVARALHPEQPSALDLPTWVIGRRYCDAGAPHCVPCPLTMVCAKDVEGAALAMSS